MSINGTADVDFAPMLANAFFREVQEFSRREVYVAGELPTYVLGSIFLNGPAKFHFDNGYRYQHWLDGDGMVCAIHFEEQGIFVDSKYVLSRKFLNESREENAETPIYRAFGSAFPGDRLKRGLATESPYNVSVFPYKDKLLAFGEQSLPMELDPVTLRTLTPGKTFDFDRGINDALPFSAHPKIDSSGELLNFGVFYDPKQPLLYYYRIDSNGTVACRKRTKIDHPYSVHDFASSKNYVVFYLSPYLLDAKSLVLHGNSTMDSLRWEPTLGSEILVLCRWTGREILRQRIDAKYCLHTINAFETGNSVYVDLIEFDKPVYDHYKPLPHLFDEVPLGNPVRLKIDFETTSVTREIRIAYRNSPDFPCIEPFATGQEYERFWMLGISNAGQRGRKFFDRLIQADWSSPDIVSEWYCPKGCVVGGEPVFVPDPVDSCGGAVVIHLYHSNDSSEFAVFDTRSLTDGPVARIKLPTPIHLCFHASFRPRDGATQRDAKIANGAPNL